MNNNIANMNSVNPAGYNPQGHKAPAQQENAETKEAQTETPQNNDPLKYVPAEQYGRAMVNQAQNSQRPQVNAQNIQDDVFTFKLMQEFTQDLINGYIQKGVEPKKAQEMAACTVDVLLNPPQAKVQ